MSLLARQTLVDSPYFVCRTALQRNDFLGESLIKSDLIALLLDLVVAQKRPIVVTAARSDHHPENWGASSHDHENGWALDLWPLRSLHATDYVPDEGEEMEDFLRAAAANVWLYQIGLGGGAWTQANRAAAGATVFEDNGQDHLHIAAR